MPFIGRAARRSRPALTWGTLSAGDFSFISAATAAMFGAADEVPKKLGRFCDRFVGVAGWPGNGGWEVSMIWPGVKNDVLPPSGPEITGFWTSTAAFVEPSGFRALIPGPNELYGSLASGCWLRYGGAAHQGTAPTPMLLIATWWPSELG